MSKRQSTDLWRTNIMGDAPASCKGCAYLDSRRCCNYSGVTGQTRLGKIARILGTREGRKYRTAIKCENCEFWEPKT